MRKRADGRWEASLEDGYRADGSRRRRFVYGRTRLEATEKLRGEQHRLANGLPTSDQRRTTGQYLRWWIGAVVPGSVSRGSEDTYRRTVELYVIPHLGRVPLAKLTPADVTAMTRAMADGSSTTRPLSAATQSQARRVLSIALRRAEQEGLVIRNAARLSDGPRVVHRVSPSLTPTEARTLMLELSTERLGSAYVLQLALGLRRGEVLGIRWDDLELDAVPGRLRVRSQIQRSAGGGLELVALKTQQSRRDLVLPAPLVTELKSWGACQARERLYLGPAWRNDWDLVFTTPAGTPMDPSNYRRRLLKAATRAGIGPRTTHDLRHAAGSILFGQGVPMKLISESLGHTSERITSDTYVHTERAHLEVVAAAMSEALWPDGDGASGTGA